MVVNGSGYASQSYNDVFLKNWMAKEENAKAQEGQPGVQGDSAQAGGVFADGRQRKEAGTEGVSGGNGMETETEKEKDTAWRYGALQDILRHKFGMDEEEIEKMEENYSIGVPKKGEGGPYSHLADENGVIEYNGVTFLVNKEKNWLCLGDVSNLKNVICIPLSEGGCLMVNRGSIGALGRAIGMFSPEDVNRILRALKMDAKIQEMKKEIEDMEDGIGKGTQQQYADSAETAKEAAEKDAGGFNGYGMKEEEDGVFRLKDWQLALLLGEDEETLGKGVWQDTIVELAGKREEEGSE